MDNAVEYHSSDYPENVIKTHWQSLDTLNLQRLPQIKNKPLRAWDAADEYLITYLRLVLHNTPEQKPERTLRCLIVNDAFGALCCALRDHGLVNWSDSHVAHRACQHNLNTLNSDANIEYIPSTMPPSSTPKGTFDWVLIKLPKNITLLEQQLISMKPFLSPNTRIVAAGMVKHWAKQAQAIFEKVIGSNGTATSKAVKKARLLFCSVGEKASHAGSLHSTQMDPYSDYPHGFHHCLEIPEYNLTLHQHANVFGAKHLDVGARLMLEQFKHLPPNDKVYNAIDLGCGNGVLGIVAQRLRQYSIMHFVDESYMAVDSASHNHAAALGDEKAEFWVSHCLDDVNANDVGLILCNPPFHQQHSLDDQVARIMFEQSKKRLSQHGELWVVGNRHLNYSNTLNRLMGNADILAQNSKFQVIRSVKR